jgi:release factor glutamine methyltransferase
MNEPRGDAASPLAGAVTIAAALAAAAERLAAAGIVDSRREARRIVALALGVEPGTVLGYPERPIDTPAQHRLAALLARRAAREPFSRLEGRRGFWSLDFALSPDTLDPRPDSETLIEAALERLPDRGAGLRVLDLGTGTGCLLLALLAELPNATGVGVDILPGAVATARRNAAALGLAGRAAFLCGDWGAAIAGGVDVILSNPPYIPTGEIETLAGEVARYDPRAALDGGFDGFTAYRRLARETRRLLNPAGVAFFELGAGQAAAVAGVMAEAGLEMVGIRRDLAGIERCIALTLLEGKRAR